MVVGVTEELERVIKEVVLELKQKELNIPTREALMALRHIAIAGSLDDSRRTARDAIDLLKMRGFE